MAWLGVDVGTSSTKAVVYTDTGRPVGDGRAPTPWRRGLDGVDVDPTALRESAVAAIAAALDRTPPELAIGGIGITSMGETGVLVDGHGAPVAQAIAWHDTRDAAEAAQLGRDVDAAVFARRTGKPVSGAYALTKHRWLRTHVPTSRSAVRRFNVAEWVARGLGGEEVGERSLCSRTGWLDLRREAFDEELLAWSGAAASLLPPLVVAGTPVGRVGAGRAHHRLTGAVVTIAGHDHQAAATGVGATAAGDLLDSSGTAEALLRTVEAGRPPAEVEALAAAGITTDLGVRPGYWSVLGGTQGGLALRRVLDVLGVAWEDLAGLDAQALAAADGNVEVSGIDADVVRIDGVGDGAGPGHVWRAAALAATREAAAIGATIEAIVGPRRRLVVTGGWCASGMVLDAKRRLFGPLTVADVDEAGALGAATLAARAAGHLGPDDVLAG